MSKLNKLLALVLALTMVFALAACGSSSKNTPLVVGYSPFNSKFSPFFSETAYDQDAMALTQILLLGNDRTGGIITKGIEGETVEYNGTPYTYYGPADLEITENADGTVYYDFTLRDDIVFSDGEPLTIDDVIFSMYVLCDPTYDGSSTLYAQPIEGMAEYRSGMDTLFNLNVNYMAAVANLAAAEAAAEEAAAAAEEAGSGEAASEEVLVEDAAPVEEVPVVEEAPAEEVPAEEASEEAPAEEEAAEEEAAEEAEEEVPLTPEELQAAAEEAAAAVEDAKAALEEAEDILKSVASDEEIETFQAAFNDAGAAFAQEIIDYCVDAGYGETDAEAAAAWGFEIPEDGTAEDFFAVMCDAYGWDIGSMSSTESAGSSFFDLMEGYDQYTSGVQTGESASSITGIQKTGDYSMRVVLTQVDATAIYQLGIYIAPMHYYGDPELYDYDNDSFGFPKGDLSSVRAKTTQPMGAGPYKFIKFENGVINYEANESYYKGAPKTKYINFVETTADQDKLNGIMTGTIDVSDPSFTNEAVDEIMQTNSNGELTGDVITTNTVDNLGYGYIGQNAINVKVGDDPASDASKALRKAFGTIFSVYREVAIDSYYGDRAAVINYPISNTSWAAPRPADDGYKVAFSTDADGNDIYTADMTAEEKYDAALQAALGWFEAAGYTVEDGKLTEAPEGAKLEYTFWIPADGIGDHPAFMIVNEAKNALATIGMNLIIKDLSNSSDLWDNLDAIQVEMWAAAWGATIDPDMYQIYFSDVANGPTTDAGKNPLGGPEQGGSNYEYCIADPELDELIMEARASTDQAYRKAMYKACLDIVVDWAVETPTYQRQNAVLFSTERVDMKTVTPDITTFYPWMSEIENTVLK